MVWVAGKSGNPAGRPKGSVSNEVALIKEFREMAFGGGKEILRRLIRDAQAGDRGAVEILVTRIWPVRKGQLLQLDIPIPKCAAEIPNSTGKVLQYITEGTISPEEGQSLMTVIESHRRAMETCELEIRIAKLEAAGNATSETLQETPMSNSNEIPDTTKED